MFTMMAAFIVGKQLARDLMEKVKYGCAGDRTLITLTGVLTYANEEIYDGSWTAGLRDGHGTFQYENGDIYIGNQKVYFCL